MKKYPDAFNICIIIVISILSLISCNKYSENPQLTEAARVFEASPDSALTLLNCIDSAKITESKDKAYYHLLLSEARYMNYVDTPDTAGISESVKFYSDGKNKNLFLKSVYFLARAYYNGRQWDKALRTYLKAETLAEDLGDYRCLGNTYRDIAYIYSHVYNGQGQLFYSKKAYEAYKRYGDEPLIESAKMNLSLAYANIYDYSHSLALADSIADYAEEVGNRVLLANSMLLKATAMVGQGNSCKALDLYKALWEIDPRRFQPMDEYNLLLCAGICDSADTLPASMKGYIDSIKSIYGERHEVLAKHGKYDQAYDQLLIDFKDMRSEIDSLHIQTVTLTAEKNAREIAENQRRELESERIKRILIVCAGILLIIIVIGVAMFQRKQSRRRKDEIVRLNAEILREVQNRNELERVSGMQSGRISELHNRVRNLLSSRLEFLDNLCIKYFSAPHEQISAKKKNEVFHEIETEIQSLKEGSQAYSQLKRCVDEFTDGAVSAFMEEFPGLKSDYYRLYLYTIAGFSAPTIALLLSADLRRIYNLRYRLKVSIEKSDSPNKELYLSWL